MADNTREEFDKKAKDLARHNKEKHDNEVAAYTASLQKKIEEESTKKSAKLRKKGMTTDQYGKEVSREEQLKHDLRQITSRAANTTSNWQEALMQECTLCYDFIKILNLDMRKGLVKIKGALNQELGEWAEKGGKRGLLAHGAQALLNPTVTIGIPMKTKLLYDFIKGGPSGALPVLYDSVHFKDGKITVDSLKEQATNPATKGKFNDIEQSVGKIQGLLETGVALWLEDQGYDVTKTTDAKGNFAYEASRKFIDEAGNERVEKMDEADFNRLKMDKKNGFQPFLNGQYKEQAKVFKEEYKMEQQAKAEAQNKAGTPQSPKPPF